VPRCGAAADVHVVAVEGDVELAERDPRRAQLLDAVPQALRERDSARMDPDERDPLEVAVALDDLVGDPRQCPRDRVGVEDGSACRDLRTQSAVRAYLTFDSFPASRDRVKGVRLGAEP
jgi:hypothetical protein